jgi:AmiR/NasT family two-component response regulator
MDEPTAHEQMWHEDDVLHQAEGVLAARLGTTSEHAARALRAHAEAEGIDPREIAPGVIDGSVHVTP